MRHDFLEDEEERMMQRFEQLPVEEGGFMGLASSVQKALAVAGAAFDIAPQTDSPIEATLGARLKLLIDQWPNLLLVPQYPLHRFRYDFGIVEGAKLICALECDGLAFHSSEAAIRNDRAKDVAIWQAGAEIFRFTGRQIFRRDVDCVAAVEAFLIDKYGRA